MRYLVLAALALFSSFSFADDYFWYTGSIDTSGHYSSPVALCTVALSGLNTSDIRYVYKSVTISGASGTCYHEKFTKSPYPPYDETSVTMGFVSIYRSGTTCPPGGIYNSTTGVCDLPSPNQGQLCPDQTGATSALPNLVKADGTCVNYIDADLPTTCKYLGNISATENVKISATENVKVAGVILPADSTDPNATPNVVPPAKFKNGGCRS